MMPIQAMRLRQRRKLLLDLYPVGASAAFSVARRLHASASLCLRIKRSSDNTERDIGFSDDSLDVAGLLAFVGSGNGDVTRIYEQRNGNVGYVSGTGSRLVTAGVVATLGGAGRPAMTIGSEYLTSSNGNFGTSFSLSGDLTFTGACVFRKTTANAGSAYGWGNYNASLGACGLYDDNSVSGMSFAGGNNRPITIPAVNLHQLSVFTKSPGAISTTATTYRNGANVATGSPSAGTPSVAGAFPLTIGAWAGLPSNKLLGQFQELVLWANDYAADRAGITSNINDFYGVY